MTNFAQVANNAVTTLASGRSLGASTLTVATGTGSLFPTPTATNPVKLTLVTSATRGATPETLTILQATGRSGDTFSGLTVVESSTDRAYSAGDYVELRLTAGHVSAIHDAVNTAETTLAAVPSTYSPIAGSASITTVGTIASGTWSGTTIAVAKGGTGLTSLGTAYQLLGVNSGATGYQATSIAGGTGITVSTATNTITVTLGNHDAGLITTGTVGTARLGSGSATSSTFLRGDSTWATPTGSVAIGSAVSSGTAGSVLFVDASGNLGQSNAALLWDTTNLSLSVTSSTANQAPLIVKNSAATGKSRLRIDAGANANSGFFLASGGTDKFEIANVVSGGTNFSYFVYNLQTSRYAFTLQGDKDRIGIGGLTSPSGQLHVRATDTTTATCILQAIASQGASYYLLDARNSGGTTVASIDISGTIIGGGTVQGGPGAGGLLKPDPYSALASGYWKYSTTGGTGAIYGGSGAAVTVGGTGAQLTIGNTSEVFRIGTPISTGTYSGVEHVHKWSDNGATAWSSTINVAQHRITGGFGSGSLTYTGTQYLTSLAIEPTINVASGSTGNWAGLRINPTYTALGTGIIPNPIVVQNGSTDRWMVDRHGRMVSAAAASSVAAGTGAGTSPTVSIAGTDQAGVLTITTGTTPSSSATVATITLANALATAPRAVVLTPANGNAAALSGNGAVYVDSASTSTTAWVVKVGSSALTASTTYLFHFHLL